MATSSSIVSLLTARISKGTGFESNEQSKETELVEHLYRTIQNFISCSSYTIENDVTLDCDDSFDDSSSSASENSEIDEEVDATFSEDQDGKSILNNFSLDYMKQVLAYYDEVNEQGNQKHSWRSLNHRFKILSDSSYLTRFRRYVNQNGTKYQKLDSIDSSVFSLFENARAKSFVIHDGDLQRWARKTAEELSLTSFSASTYWVHCFKKRYNIISRKITKHAIENEGDIVQSAEQFVGDVRLYIRSHALASYQIINTDQVGFRKEIHSNRTLSFRGERITFASIKSKHACTHSYTLQPSINMAGEVVGPIFLCLQEAAGKISDAVKKNIFEANNVVVSCSKSGKLSSTHVPYWLEHVLLPHAPDKFLLLSDAWDGQRADSIYKSYRGCFRLEIPKTTADKIQPLDIVFNRQMKYIFRRVYDRINLDQLPISMSERNNIIKLASLCYSQMSAEIFHGLIKYAWYTCGYSTTDPGSFLTVKDVCFAFISPYCQISNCTCLPFISCSWCRSVLCFDHFVTEYHFH